MTRLVAFRLRRWLKRYLPYHLMTNTVYVLPMVFAVVSTLAKCRDPPVYADRPWSAAKRREGCRSDAVVSR
jgi:hypothetical protein